jgi:multiple sugar transport system substrate-binding protein
VFKKSIKRRAILTASVGVSLALALTACTGANTSSAGVSSNKTVVIGMNSGLVSQYQAYAADFEKTKPGFKVVVKAVPDVQSDYIQQLVTQGLSKTLPDIVFNYDSLNQTLVASHLLYNIKPWLDAGHDGLKGSSFQPNFLGQYDVGSTITGIPVSADAGILFYNKTLFAKYGITDLPTASWTYDDMYRVAQEITTKSGGTTFGLRTPIGDSSNLFQYYPVLRAYGSNIYDPTSKKFIFANAAGIRAWTEILKPYIDGFGSPLPTASNTGLTLFSGGQAAMATDTRPQIVADRSTLKDDWDVQALPTINGKSTTGGGSYSLSISQKSGNKENAWKFMAWFYSASGGMKFAAPNGVIPATKTGLASGAWLTDKNPVPANLIATTKYAVANAILPNVIPNSAQPQVVPALQKALQEVVLQHESITQAYTDAQNSLNALLTK